MHPLWLVLVLLPVLGGAERFNCRGRILGAYYADAKSGCKAFHVCVRVAGGGIRDFRFFCPPGTLFHQEAQTCTDWGDDDPLACPADIYDGQFDLYKIGSGFDTKKLSSSGNRDEESEFSLQRAETGDRRLSQNNAASDLRAAHSSDFFSGQRDRGRDDPAPQTAPGPQRTSAPQQALAPQQSPVPQQQAAAQQTHHRQSFRRPTTRVQPPTTQFTDPPPSPLPQQPSKPQYDPKRKLVRKRPVYVSTPAPTTTFLQNTQPSTSYPEQLQQSFNRRNLPQNRQTLPPVNVPPQYKEYKDEYVEVSRVTPKPNKFIQSNSPPAPFSQSSPVPNFNNKKEGLVELYNYDAQSTPGLNNQNNNGPFKVRNSFSVADPPKESDYFRPRTPNVNTNNVRVSPTTVDYNVAVSRSTTSTPDYLNFNSVSYEPEKNSYLPYSKQNYFNNPTTTTPPTTAYTTTARSDPPPNLNTVAYNTNIGFNTQQANFADNDEDDGQYRLPQGEDDGQYRPELYDRELLSGAHSLNIAASGNRLPEDQKPRGKTQPPFKHVSQTAAPRPFRPAPTSISPSTQRVPEQTFPTTFRPQTQTQTQRTFDYYQTYTTTSRPIDVSVASVSFNNFDVATNAPARQTTTTVPRNVEPRVPSRVPTLPPSTSAPPAPPSPTTRQPFFAKPPKNKEDASYDYAYYDSDPGFSEYDHIEEFGRTKKKA